MTQTICRIYWLVAFLLMCSALRMQSQTAASATPNVSQSTNDGSLEGKNFFRRLAQAYKDDWSAKSQSGPPAPSRIPPPPLDSPPFPNAYWNYGGSSVIGATNTTSFPLMGAIYSGSSGDAWKRSGVQIYGWINPGFDFGTSPRSALPLGYNFYPNRIELDQFVTYIERVPDTVQTEHID